MCGSAPRNYMYLWTLVQSFADNPTPVWSTISIEQELYCDIQNTIANASIDRDSQHYSDDRNTAKLRLNTQMLPDLLESKRVNSVKEVVALAALNGSKWLYSEVIKLITLLRLLPATSAMAEQSFSPLRRMKTYLRAWNKSVWTIWRSWGYFIFTAQTPTTWT